MPITIVVGAQYGSEGKGKVALNFAKLENASAVVRVGGPNSGHTIIGDDGAPQVFRQLPTAAIIPNVVSILPAGSYIDLTVLSREIETVGATPATLAIDPRAVVISDNDRQSETDIKSEIGSTGSGTGAALVRRLSRDGSSRSASEFDELRPFLADTISLQRGLLADGRRIVIEGTQGFGLSPLHGGHGKFSTSRDTTAAGFLSEAGMSPLDVDNIVLVARAFPIRVAGNSGPLEYETTWDLVARSAGQPDLKEFTTVTQRLRRVGEFDPTIVSRSILANAPSTFVMNHVDYIGDPHTDAGIAQIESFLTDTERSLGLDINYVGMDRVGIVVRTHARRR